MIKTIKWTGKGKKGDRRIGSVTSVVAHDDTDANATVLHQEDPLSSLQKDARVTIAH
jgi:hypothetical protein